jgi:prepilin-type N-terminal cleavage/methylation domain-containing protein
MQPESSRRWAKSLVELLVALAIIGLMLGIFLPAAMSVYKAALKLGQ